MSTPATVFSQATEDVIELLGQDVTYRGSAGEVEARVFFAEEPALFGSDVRANERRWLVTIKRSEVADPAPGDSLVDENGTVWHIDVQETTDELTETWSTYKR